MPKIIFYWFSIAFILALIIGHKEIKKTFKEIKNNKIPLILIGVIEGIATILFLISLNYLGPSLTSFFTQFTFIFVLIYSLVFLKEKFKKRTFIGITLAIIGALIINYSIEINILKGTLIALTTAFLLATSSFIAKKKIKK